MNARTTHADWHPGESPDWLTAAIERVRAEVAAESAGMTAQACEDGSRRDEAPAHDAEPMRERTAPQKANAGGGGGREDYAVGEWYHRNRIIRGEELRGVYRRMNRQGNVHTEEPIGRGAPTTLTIIRGGKDATPVATSRKCEVCGTAYSPNAVWQKYCGKACSNKAHLARKRGRTA